MGATTRRAFVSGVAALGLAAAAKGGIAGRPFRMGTTRWPPDLTLKALGQVERFIRDECDMAAPMVLGGVPWVAMDRGESMSAALLAELRWRPPGNHAICLSLGPLDLMRTGLAPLYAESDNQPVPTEWAELAFDHPRVVDAYSRFCVEAVDVMRPDYLVAAVEVNILLHMRPEAWRGLVTLLEETHRRVRVVHPSVKLGISMTLTHLFGLSDGAVATSQRDGMLEILEHADFAGFSVYPHTSWDIPQPVPLGWYDRITEFGRDAGKPVAITESGMTSQTFWAGIWRIKGSDDLQIAHLQSLLDSADRGNWLFVVNWTSHDYPDLMERIPPEVRSLAKIWTHTGLRTGDGTDKPALSVWREHLRRPLSI